MVGFESAFHLMLYVLFVSWPVSLYLACRILRLPGRQAVACAAVATLVVSQPQSGYEASSYVWAGFGLWTQLWGAWTLPIALALGYEALAARRSVVLAGCALAVTALVHPFTGWLGFAVLAVAAVASSGRRMRVVRLGAVCAVAGALASWFFIPIWLDRSGAVYEVFARTTALNPFYESYGARDTIRSFASGSLFDNGRLPVVTVLAVVGVLSCARRIHEGPHRLFLLLIATSAVLYAMGTSPPSVTGWLPFREILYFPRFLLGVHLGGILLAGEGLMTLQSVVSRWLSTAWPRPAAIAMTIASLVLVLSPAIRERVDYARLGRTLAQSQDAADVSDGVDLSSLLQQIPGGTGRVFAGSAEGWGRRYTVGHVPVYIALLEARLPSIGFFNMVSSVGSLSERAFDESDRTHYAKFGVRWLVLPEDRRPLVPAILAAVRGRHRLYEVPSPAVVEIVDATTVLSVRAQTLIRSIPSAPVSFGPFESDRVLLRWKGNAGLPNHGGAGSPGRVLSTAVARDYEKLSAKVETTRQSYVAFAQSWHPRWRAWVDGAPASVVMIEPGTLGIAVGPGLHQVVVAYDEFEFGSELAIGGAVLVFAVSFVASRIRWWSSRSRSRNTA